MMLSPLLLLVSLLQQAPFATRPVATLVAGVVIARLSEGSNAGGGGLVTSLALLG